MTILELADFKTVKALKTHLNEHSIAFSKKYGHILFAYSFCDIPFLVTVNNLRDAIASFTLEMGADACDHDQLWIKRSK